MTRWSRFPKVKQQIAHLIGAKEEQRARQFLEAKGLVFVAQNYRCKAGEIDLVMQEQGCLVFVEVKYRSNKQHGSAVEFFTISKRQKLHRAINHYLQAKRINEAHAELRIDLVAIDGKAIQWLKAV